MIRGMGESIRRSTKNLCWWKILKHGCNPRSYLAPIMKGNGLKTSVLGNSFQMDVHLESTGNFYTFFEKTFGPVDLKVGK